jgi:hypothetical protein
MTPSVALANESIRLACKSPPNTSPTNERTFANFTRRQSETAIVPLQPMTGWNIYGVASNRVYTQGEPE